MVPNKKMWTQFGANYNVFAKVAKAADFKSDAAIKKHAKAMGIKGKVVVANASEYRVIKV
jgi:hypothetical protein